MRIFRYVPSALWVTWALRVWFSDYQPSDWFIGFAFIFVAFFLFFEASTLSRKVGK